jgi:hypothetical protein
MLPGQYRTYLWKCKFETHDKPATKIIPRAPPRSARYSLSGIGAMFDGIKHMAKEAGCDPAALELIVTTSVRSSFFTIKVVARCDL